MFFNVKVRGEKKYTHTHTHTHILSHISSPSIKQRVVPLFLNIRILGFLPRELQCPETQV